MNLTGSKIDLNNFGYSSINVKEFNYLLFLSIKCLKCLNILTEFTEFKESIEESKIYTIIDCSVEELGYLNKHFNIKVPIQIIDKHNTLYEYLEVIPTPSLFKIKHNYIENIIMDEINSLEDIINFIK